MVGVEFLGLVAFLVYCAVESRNNLEIFEGEDDEERDKRRVVFYPMLNWFLFGKR